MTTEQTTALKRHICGEYIGLALIKDLNDNDLWNMAYAAFHKIFSLRINDEEENISGDKVSQQWDIFKSTGVIMFRKIDEAEVKDILKELKYAVRKYVDPFQ